MLTAGLEMLVRLSQRLAVEASQVDPASGLPRIFLQKKLAELKNSQPRVVFVGDSFVETGEIDGGWVRRLQQKNPAILSLGYAGATTSQYMHLYNAARSQGFNGHIAIVLYLGNDLEDETIWLRTADKTRYTEARRTHFANPSTPLFWPCYDASDPRGPLRRRLSLYKSLVTTAVSRMRSTSAGLTEWASLDRLLRTRCTKPAFTEIVNGQLFFFRHHEALIANARQKESWEPLMKTVDSLARDRNASVVVLLAREENCSAMHRRPVSTAQPILDDIRSRGVRVIDPNDRFRRACHDRFPYLPDGHWNEIGQTLFAEAMAEAFGLRKYLR